MSDWNARLIESNGRIVSNLPNLVTILTHDPEVRGLLRYDAFADHPTLERKPPFPAFNDTYPRRLSDPDVLGLEEWLQHRYSFPNNAPYLKAIQRAAALDSYNPVWMYLTEHPWDGEERIAHIYTDILGAAHQDPFATLLIRRWLISAVARVMQPGCQVDQMLVLQGHEGVGKSSFFRILGGEWSLETTLAIDSKDQLMSMRVGWLVEFSEFSSIAGWRREERVRAVLTRTRDVYRRPWDRFPVDQPRHCVFCATVNPNEFLTTAPGNRRYWPIRAGTVDRDVLSQQRDQIWAEAVHAYQQREPWYLGEQSEIEQLSERHEQHGSQDEWMEILRDKLLGRPEIKTTTVLIEELGIPAKDIEHKHKMRVADILKNLGFKRERINRDWVWVRQRPL